MKAENPLHGDEGDPMPELWKDGFTNPEYTAWYERNKPKDLGPPSDFGWVECHGCGVDSDRWDVAQHKPDCPRVCTLERCHWHGR